MEKKSAHTTNYSGKNETLRILLIILAILTLGTGALLVGGKKQTGVLPGQKVDSPGSAIPKPVTSGPALVYGVWEGKESVIHAVNTDGSGDTVLTRLPSEIKNVKIISPNQLLYIGETDAKDHGRFIYLRNITTGKDQIVVRADSGWGIDSVIVSPDNTWIAYWQVQLGSSGQLTGGKSRVYSASLAALPAIRKLIYDESADAGTIVHYPLFFDHSGNLYADGFSPNEDGWNLGLMKTTATGGSPVEVLPAYSYNTDPVVSPDSDLIAYTAYDPALEAPISAKRTSGKDSTASLNPNSVNVLDLTTNVTRRLLGESGRVYYDPTWRSTGDSIFVRSYGADGTKLVDPKALSVSLASGNATEMDTEQQPDGMIISYGPDGLIVGVSGNDNSIGNLGSTYAPVFSAITAGSGSNSRTIVGGNSQYIGTLSTGLDGALLNPAYSNKKESLQLATFSLKPELIARAAQQNDPTGQLRDGRERCRDIYSRVVSGGTTAGTNLLPTLADGQTGGDATIGKEFSLQLGRFGPNVTVTQQLSSVPTFKQLKPELKDQYKCYDSPLYLYPEKTTAVSVKVINSQILSSNLPYGEKGWSLTAKPGGVLYANNISVNKIEYSYASSFTAPNSGLVVKSKDLSAKLQWYAVKLGLSGRETDDYVSFWTKELPKSSYYLVSHFSSPSAIMNFEISPKPDTFIQAIMYFKPLESNELVNYKGLTAPTFSSVPVRSGFVAVDWSGIID